MTTTKWAAGYTSLGTILTNTELASKANNANSDIGAVYDNTTGLYTFGGVRLVLGTMTAPTAGYPVYVYYTTAINGTDYTVLDHNSCNQLTTLSCIATTTSVLEDMGFVLPAVKFKLFVRNASGQAFGASGNSLELFGTNLQNV